MARVAFGMATTKSNDSNASGAIRFSTVNWIILLAGLLAIIGGYFSLAAGSIILAPLLLVLGYAVLIPIGIIR